MLLQVHSEVCQPGGQHSWYWNTSGAHTHTGTDIKDLITSYCYHLTMGEAPNLHRTVLSADLLLLSAKLKSFWLDMLCVQVHGLLF